MCNTLLLVQCTNTTVHIHYNTSTVYQYYYLYLLWVHYLAYENKQLNLLCVCVQYLYCTLVCPPDYDPRPFTVNFPLNAGRACTNIPIVDDEIFERYQYFHVCIVVPPDLSLTPGHKANISPLWMMIQVRRAYKVGF